MPTKPLQRRRMQCSNRAPPPRPRSEEESSHDSSYESTSSTTMEDDTTDDASGEESSEKDTTEASGEEGTVGPADVREEASVEPEERLIRVQVDIIHKKSCWTVFYGGLSPSCTIGEIVDHCEESCGADPSDKVLYNGRCLHRDATLESAGMKTDNEHLYIVDSEFEKFLIADFD